MNDSDGHQLSKWFRCIQFPQIGPQIHIERKGIDLLFFFSRKRKDQDHKAELPMEVAQEGGYVKKYRANWEISECLFTHCYGKFCFRVNLWVWGWSWIYIVNLGLGILGFLFPLSNFVIIDSVCFLIFGCVVIFI